MKYVVVFVFLSLAFNMLSQIDSTELNQKLEEVVIAVSKNTNEFYAKPDHFILDMLEDSSGLIILLKKRNEYSIEKVAWNGFTVARSQLPFKTKSISSDCLGNLYLHSVDDFFQRFHFTDDTIAFDETFGSLSYQMEIEPCMAQSHSKLLFRSLSDNNQTIYLWTFDFSSDSSQTVYRYADSISIKSNQDEQRIIRQENYTNHERMADITVPELELLKDEQERAMFFSTIVTQAPENPVFSYGQRHYFFNFMNDSVFILDDQFVINSAVASPLNSETRKKALILLDKTNGNFFYINPKKRRLERLSLTENQRVRTYQSKGVQSSRQIIHNNAFFFLGKSSSEDSFNKIFREKL